MSHLTQMTGLAFHNFVSAAAGAAVAVAFIRGLVRRRTRTLGNFWVDLIRTCVRVLLPLAFVAAIVLMSQGVIDNFHASPHGHHGRRPDPDDPRRPGGQPGGDQGGRPERRRLLRRQLGPPVREPQRDHQPAARCG